MFKVFNSKWVAPSVGILILSLTPASLSFAEDAPELYEIALDDMTKPYEIAAITEGLYAFRNNFYRNIFIITEEGVIATDPLTVEGGQILHDEIAKLTDKPVKYVAYSHSHWDHAQGAQAFKEDGAQIVAQEMCAANFLEHPNPDVVTPDITFKDSYKIELGGSSLELYYYGPSHDNCLSVMIARPANILFFVDVVNPPSGWQMFYNPTLADTYMYNIIPYLKAVEELVKRENIENVIGGHVQFDLTSDLPETGSGFPSMAPMISDVSIIAERRMFYEGIIDAVNEQRAAGTPDADIPALLVKKKLLADKIIGYDDRQMEILLERIVTYAQTGE